jgi:hypothetical protein
MILEIVFPSRYALSDFGRLCLSGPVPNVCTSTSTTAIGTEGAQAHWDDWAQVR